MKTLIILTTLSLSLSTLLNGQGINKAYVDKWVKTADNSFAIDSVKRYYINEHCLTSFDTLDLSSKLKEILPNEIVRVSFSEMNMCGYEPGRGFVSIISIHQQPQEKINEQMEYVKELFVGNDNFLVKYLLNSAKLPTLYIDRVVVPRSRINSVLNELDPNNLLLVDFCPFPISTNLYPFPMSNKLPRQNERNGVVQIWKKK
ncbi:hypothetical protein [Hymenobacter saemangeumensis]